MPQLEHAVPYYRERLLVRPGVTGLAQVQLPAEADLHSVHNKLMYDLYYVGHFGFRLDIRICAATVLKMVGTPFTTIRSGSLPGKDRVRKEYEKRWRWRWPAPSALTQPSAKIPKANRCQR